MIKLFWHNPIQSFFRFEGIEIVAVGLHSQRTKVIALRKELNDQGLSIPWSPPGVSPQVFDKDLDRSKDYAWNQFPILDVTVLNRASARTVITKITLDARVEVQSEAGPLSRSHIPPSWDYSAMVDLKSEHQQLAIPVLDEIGPDRTSRFFVTIGNNKPQIVAKVTIDASLESANGEQIELGTFEFQTTPHHPGPGRCVAVVQPAVKISKDKEPSEPVFDYPKEPVDE